MKYTVLYGVYLFVCEVCERASIIKIEKEKGCIGERHGHERRAVFICKTRKEA